MVLSILSKVEDVPQLLFYVGSLLRYFRRRNELMILEDVSLRMKIGVEIDNLEINRLLTYRA